MSDIYSQATIRKVDNGWIVEYFSSREREKVFTNLKDALKFVEDRVK